MPSRQHRLPDGTYVELVRSLFATLPPTAIMSILFVVVASMAVQHQPDPLLILLGIVGVVGSLLRVAIVVACQARSCSPGLDVAGASRMERVFAAAYLSFATILGLFAARAIDVSDIAVQMVVAALVVGYAAGVAAGVSLRPWISIPAVLSAVLPAALSAGLRGNLPHAVLALVLTALLAGGIGSMVTRYRSETEKISMRQAFASLARTDPLTGLANRLGLADAYAATVATGGAGAIAVHCLDLDRFKPVNDRFGHPVGDLLLQRVADRLRDLCRDGDVAVRLGGDEFVLLQTGIGHDDEAALLARRIVRVLAEPYVVDGHHVAIGVSVGYTLPGAGVYELHQLLGHADEALYVVKREGGCAAGHARMDDRAAYATA